MEITRRHLLRSALAVGAVVGGGALITACGLAANPFAAPAPSPTLPPPERKDIRVGRGAACDPFAWMCEPYLKEEGFTDVQTWVGLAPDLYVGYTPFHLTEVDAGSPQMILAGMHSGCPEVWARAGIGSIAELRDKVVALPMKTQTVQGVARPTPEYALWASVLAENAMQRTHVQFLEVGTVPATLTALAEGKADAIMTVSTQGPLLHADPKNTAKAILSLGADMPWRPQVCCYLAADSGFVKANPVAAKRATRALLRALDDATKDPMTAAKAAIKAELFKTTPAVTEQTIVDVNKHAHIEWRSLDMVESIRFYAKRLSDFGLFRMAPQQVIDDSTDLAWMRQLQRDLK